MQTFKGMWHAKFKYPELCRNMIFLPADLHGEIHQEDGVWRLAYAHIINPIEVRLGLSGLSLNLNMKNHNTRNLWLIIIMSAGLVWLDGLGIPEQTLRDVPGRLLPLTQHNLPVHDFIGFLFYHCLPVHEWKRSLRVSNSTHLDWLWRYSIILYGDTRMEELVLDGHQIREARASGAKKALVAGAAAAEEEAWSDDSDVPLDKVTHLPTRLFSYSSPPLTIQFYGKSAGVLAKSSTGGGAKSAEDEAAVAKRAADGVKIRAMALAVRDEEDGTDDRRPTKIVSQLACEGATVMYRVMYHDPGYHPATLYEDRSADWCRKWPGLVENYEKAAYIILPCYLTPPHHVSFESESTNLKTDPRPCGLSRAWRPI